VGELGILGAIDANAEKRAIVMGDESEIVYLEEPAWDIIGAGINHSNKQQAGDEHACRLCYALRTPDQEIVGGVIGMTYSVWKCIAWN
jgi:hypothetical protein